MLPHFISSSVNDKAVYRIALATPGLVIIEGRPWPGNSRSRSPLAETVPDQLQPDLQERHCSLNTCTVHTHHVPHSTLHTPHSTLGWFSHRVAMSVCLSVCLFVTIQNTLFRRLLRLLVEGRIANIGLKLHNFSYFSFQ